QGVIFRHVRNPASDSQVNTQRDGKEFRGGKTSEVFETSEVWQGRQSVASCNRSMTSSGEASSRRLPLSRKDSEKRRAISCMFSCVSWEPPTSRNSSVLEIRLCPSALSRPMPNKPTTCGLGFRLIGT